MSAPWNHCDMNNLIPKRWIMPFVFALRTIRSHRARTALALLGVVIGVFAVVVVMALGDGVKGYILGQVESFGSDVIQVEVKVPTAKNISSENATSIAQGVQITTLTADDRDAIRKLPNVAAAYEGSIGQERSTYGSIGKQLLLFGTGFETLSVDGNAHLSEGRFFTDEENVAQSRVVVLGAGSKETFFGQGDAIGEYISIKGEKYRVIGIMEKRGSAAFFDLDALAYIPIQTLLHKVLGTDSVQMISIKMSDPSQETETVADIVALLRKRHDIDDPDKDDFSVTSTKEAQETVSDVLSTVTILLLALTSISLVVGGVGIMNVMYVSVSERTNEIGLRKALGARSGSILTQFLAEAVIITGVGGFLGILSGVIVVWVLSAVFEAYGFPLDISFTVQSLFLGAGFSTAVGLLFGISPAAQAAKLSPMEALRKE